MVRWDSLTLKATTRRGMSELFHSFSSVALNNSGQVAFRAEIGFVRSGVWRQGGDRPYSAVAVTDDTAPGTTAQFLDFGNPRLNDAGHTAFFGTLKGNGVSITNNSGVWSEGAGNGLELVARKGAIAPGTNARFSDFSEIVLNNRGHVAFRGTLTGPDVDVTNSFGIWSNVGGNGLALIARGGDPAPGTDASFGSLSQGITRFCP